MRSVQFGGIDHIPDDAGAIGEIAASPAAGVR
jgi:hypothetical protein